MSIKAYKGFDRNMQCRGFQYAEGGEYETDRAELCESGFHACERPLDVFGYYPPNEGHRYCEVEQDGDKKTDGEKTVSTKIKIAAEIGIAGLVKAHVEWVKSKVDQSKVENNTGYFSATTNTGDRSAATNTGDFSAATNTGYRSAATNTGYFSAATNTGDRSAATNTGDFSAAEVSGEDSIAIVTGRNSRARGAEGCWLVLTERDENRHILGVKAICIDGKKYRSGKWYMLEGGKVREVYDGE